jgi:23S rRNA pseudouridine2605 synthase
MRLNRYLAACGVASRRASESLITGGRVTVNGAVVTELGTRVAEGDTVAVDGQEVRPPEAPVYLLMHKPAGVVTTAHDPQGRRTVLDLVETDRRLFPVGRLDQETSGALLLTDDGELAHRLMHPRFGTDKEYRVVARGVMADDTVERLATGVELEDGPTAPARAEILERGEDATTLRLVIHEGRNRQVRRMLDVVGHPVLALHRTRVGPLSLGALPAGETRPLTADELAALRAAVGQRDEPLDPGDPA